MASIVVSSVEASHAAIGHAWTADDGREVVSVDLHGPGFQRPVYVTFDDVAQAEQWADTFQEAARRLRVRQIEAARRLAVTEAATDGFLDNAEPDEPGADDYFADEMAR